jgi:hypothetical protein
MTRCNTEAHLIRNRTRQSYLFFFLPVTIVTVGGRYLEGETTEISKFYEIFRNGNCLSFDLVLCVYLFLSGLHSLCFFVLFFFNLCGGTLGTAATTGLFFVFRILTSLIKKKIMCRDSKWVFVLASWGPYRRLKTSDGQHGVLPSLNFVPEMMAGEQRATGELRFILLP